MCVMRMKINAYKDLQKKSVKSQLWKASTCKMPTIVHPPPQKKIQQSENQNMDFETLNPYLNNYDNLNTKQWDCLSSGNLIGTQTAEKLSRLVHDRECELMAGVKTWTCPWGSSHCCNKEFHILYSITLQDCSINNSQQRRQSASAIYLSSCLCESVYLECCQCHMFAFAEDEVLLYSARQFMVVFLGYIFSYGKSLYYVLPVWSTRQHWSSYFFWK